MFKYSSSRPPRHVFEKNCAPVSRKVCWKSVIEELEFYKQTPVTQRPVRGFGPAGGLAQWPWAGRRPGPETGPTAAHFSGWDATIVSHAVIVLHAGILLNIFRDAKISTTSGVKCALARAGLVKKPPAWQLS